MSGFRVYASSLVPYQDRKTESLTFMIFGHIIARCSHQEVNN